MKKKFYLTIVAALLVLMLLCACAQAAVDRAGAQALALKAAGAAEADVRRLSIETEMHQGTDPAVHKHQPFHR